MPSGKCSAASCSIAASAVPLDTPGAALPCTSAAGNVAGLITADVVRSQPVSFIRLRHNLVGPPQIVEVVDVSGTQINLQGLENSLRWHTQLGGPDTVDISIKLGRGAVEGRKDTRQARVRIGGRRQLLCRGFEGGRA